jgi:hypothetical protein
VSETSERLKKTKSRGAIIVGPQTSPIAMFQVLSIFMTIIYLILLGIGVYCLILFIKLARRGIKALDIYIEEKRNNGSL